MSLVSHRMPCSVRRLLDRHEMRDRAGSCRAAPGRRCARGGADAAQAERAQRLALRRGWLPAALLRWVIRTRRHRRLLCGRRRLRRRASASSRARRRRRRAGRCSRPRGRRPGRAPRRPSCRAARRRPPGASASCRPSTVAFTRLIGFWVPRLFESTSRMPASSSTARTAPPAITPVPSRGGLQQHLAGAVAADHLMRDRVAVLRHRGRGSSWRARRPSGSRAAPRWPCRSRRRRCWSSSPTTTSAVNEKRRPPLTTLATRLIATTRSWRSSPWGFMRSVASHSAEGTKAASARRPGRPRARRRRAPSRARGTCSRRGRTRRSRRRPPWPAAASSSPARLACSIGFRPAQVGLDPAARRRPCGRARRRSAARTTPRLER